MPAGGQDVRDPLFRQSNKVCNAAGDLFPEAAANQVRHLDEESAAIAAKARLELAGEGTKTVAGEVVVVTKIKSGAGVGRIAKQELATNI